MRILYCHEDTRRPGQGGGGAETILHQHMTVLRERGHEVTWWYGEGHLDLLLDGVQPDVACVITVHNFLGMRPVHRLYERGVPVVWFPMDYWPFCGPRMLLRDTDIRCAAVEGLCDGACGQPLAPPLYAQVLARAARVMALSRGQADITRRHGVRVDGVLPPAVDTHAFCPGEREGRGVVTSTAWPGYPTKGMHILERALSRLRVAATLLYGVPHHQMPSRLREGAVYVFPSCYEETFGLCLTEAMSTGLACIASNVSGTRMQITDGENGLLVPPRDADALADALQRLLGDEALRRRLGAAARDSVVRRFSMEMLGERLDGLLEEVTGG